MQHIQALLQYIPDLFKRLQQRLRRKQQQLLAAVQFQGEAVGRGRTQACMQGLVHVYSKRTLTPPCGSWQITSSRG